MPSPKQPKRPDGIDRLGRRNLISFGRVIVNGVDDHGDNLLLGIFERAADFVFQSHRFSDGSAL